MKNLKFLIQREGDREWLPLESPTVEVLEGRYHLMAHTRNLDQFVDIQICHRYEDNGVLQEELQRRRQQPDTHGNISLVPTAYLGRGLWRVICTFPLQQADGPHLRQSINLQVLAEDCDSISDWEFVESTQVASSQEHRPAEPIATRAIESSEAWLETADEMAENEVIHVGLFDQDEVETNIEADIPDAVTQFYEQSEEFQVMLNRLTPDTVLTEAQDNNRTTTVRLPILPAEMPPTRLTQSQGANLPPDLSKNIPSHTEHSGLELLSLPRDFRWRYIPLNRLSIDRSKHAAQGADIKHAFDSLALQQRFWDNIRHLIHPTAIETDQVLTRISK